MAGGQERIAPALALLRRGDLAGARCELEEVLQSDPEQAPVLRLLGYVLQSQGDPAAAAACYERVVLAEPGDWEIWNNLGNARREAGDTHGAIAALEQACALQPAQPAVRHNLGLCLAEAGRIEDAARAFAEAVRLAPDQPAPLLELGKAFRILDRHEPALAVLTQAATLAPARADIAMERGRALSGLARYDEADAAYKRAIEIQPGLAAAFLERGMLLERGNALDRLPALLEEARDVPPSELGYLRALALEREGKAAEALREAQSSPTADHPERRAQLLGRLADKLDDPATAFAAFAEMNRLVAEQHPGAREGAEGYRRHVAALTEMMTPHYFARWSQAKPEGTRTPPVFLVGFPRSGTTLLDTMLMGHPAVHVLEEEPILQRVGDLLGDFARLPDLDAAEIDALRAVYFSELDALEPAARDKLVIDKLPLNVLGMPLIHRLFPDAKVIFAERHPCDVVLSCFMQSFVVNEAMANFLDLTTSAQLYDQVLGFWTRCREILPLDVHVLRYESLVVDKNAEMEALLAFLGLPWDAHVLDNEATAARRGLISTPSYAQVVQPIYTRASGRWERYREQLAPVLPLLLPWAERLGYS
jgi:tetratricopeptide (TPR) repeat protein